MFSELHATGPFTKDIAVDGRFYFTEFFSAAFTVLAAPYYFNSRIFSTKSSGYYIAYEQDI